MVDSGIDFETLRTERIRSNQALLASLDIPSISGTNGPSRSRKRTREGPPPRPSRRSDRILGVTPPSEPLADDIDDRISRSEKPSKTQRTTTKRSGISAPTEANPKSTRIRIAKLDSFDDYLGKLIPANGGNKAAVVAMGAGTSDISFNKYAGIIEWTNCIFLFVNVPLPPSHDNKGKRAPASSYENAFSTTERTVSFFGKPSQHSETPVIQRIVEKKDPVLLFCRYEGQQYRFFGRLELVVSSLQQSPIAFTFRMLDWSAIEAQPDAKEMIY
ncbi:hypothetical protein M427DRAFT_152648 [Gonapodya prolifera JEL478]|uniref:Uncharacterized protein n=1 Tax=Gonapodya prolifera (strain JEL478) TaxID=1344416 RepID=A0A139AQX7_GONPJ|nr:hypothetical protein M427DRAFT_152648 [Gonapodya prolifera JEL478]|eukprot:KXS19136.1 hypothetical protein M427DRAFT_152648 [Gonapodya prolifera JEL478]